jgi:Thioesterase-like superfamily
MPDAFFLPDDDPTLFHATRLTEGPWSRAAQHGGPPAALLTRTVERLPSTVGGGTQIARITFEILGPVPVGDVRVTAEVARPGRTVELVEAALSANGRPALRARAWRLRTADLALPDGVADPGAAPPALPDAGAADVVDPDGWGYRRAVEWRFVTGRFEEPGPARVWTRLRVPVVDGEQPSGLQRAVALADSGNGLSNVLDFGHWWFINTELTVHVYRQPAGEWVHLDARTSLSRAGLGLASTSLSDADGSFGTAAQALLVGPR